MLKTFCLAASTAAVLSLGACANSPSSASTGPATMAGGVLVSPNGMTLYAFDKDAVDGGKSSCNGACAALWPPLMARPTDRGSGNYTIIVRDDATRQWAYKGRPLYNYKEDKKAGDRTGDNFKDVWHVVPQ